MIEGIPRISVLIICYKQEDLIKRAINSLLAQKDYIYEICISDDCSPDRTWEVLQQYSQDYPGLFNLRRNDHNLGIFENNEEAWSMPTGDIVYRLAGDDECGEGWFKTVINYIHNTKIDYKNELFCIYGDYKAIYPNGDSFVFKNDAVDKSTDLIRLSIRGIIGNRSSCFSSKVLRKYEKVSQGKSYIAETSQDRQLQIWSEKNYYIPWVGNIYYARIGVSTAISGERWMQNVARWDYLIDNLNKWGVSIEDKDKNYIYFRKAQQMRKYLEILWYWLLSRDWSVGIKGLQLKRILFALLRRIPHNNPIKDFKI